MPIQRRMPKRGFKNIFREENQVVTLAQLDTLTGTLVTPEVLLRARHHLPREQARQGAWPTGRLKNAVKLEGLKVSAGARERIESAGGTIA
jgi:large subunit ribosomal protein L15